MTFELSDLERIDHLTCWTKLPGQCLVFSTLTYVHIQFSISGLQCY